MAANYFAGILLNPIALAILLLVVAALTALHYREGGFPVFSVRRAIAGYVFAAVTCAVVSAVMAYVSPEEALSKWKVPAENYWNAQINEFLTTFAFAVYATLIGIAVIGLPLIMWLGRRKLATVPTVLVAAAIISAAVAVLMTAGGDPPFRHFGALAQELIVGHLAVAAAFCVGAGLAWRRQDASVRT